MERYVPVNGFSVGATILSKRCPQLGDCRQSAPGGRFANRECRNLVDNGHCVWPTDR
jgi:hypothetical protein